MSMFSYVDPGLGLLAWQTLVAAAVGVLFYARKTRNWVFRLVQKPFRALKQPERDVDPQPPGTPTGR